LGENELATNKVQDDRPYPERQAPLPRDLIDVTPQWLTSVMRNRYPGLEVRDMEVVELRNGHTTKMRVKLALNDVGKSAGIPGNVCLKANWSGGFSDVDIHALEARFYHFARNIMKVPSPEVYFADWDADSQNQGFVVMEDLVTTGGTFGHSTDHIGVDNVAKAMESYAKFHGGSWADKKLETFTWLPRSMGTPIDCDQLVMMWPFVEKNLAKEEYRAFLPSWLLDDPQSFHAVFGGLRKFEQRQPGPYCIVHGDSHQGNSYIRPSGERIWIDWQLVRQGRPWRDLTYFLIGSLTIEERRANDRHLLEHYRAHLIATGAEDVPDMDTIWENYRRWPVYGCQSWIANMDEWGQDGLPMNKRFFMALDDLDTVRLLKAEHSA
jgi:hypothetical protein